MRKFVATAAVAASAAATIALTPLAAHATLPPDSEIRTDCAAGITGELINPAGFAIPFSLVPGTMFDVNDNGAGGTAMIPGEWEAIITQPGELEAYGPGLNEEKSFEFAHQRVSVARYVNEAGAQETWWNDRANDFRFFVAPTGVTTGVTTVPFNLFYSCLGGRA
jgi:hypothetical protein